ncbi:M15 family metallopeptidase [Acidovorax sp. Q11]
MPATAASPTTRTRQRSGQRVLKPRVAGCAGGIVALMLVACAHHPQAVVSSAGTTESGSPAVAVGAGHERRLCRDDPATRAGLGRIVHELQAQGLALQATCLAPGGGWVVQVMVVDGMKARQVVRGPLADGQVVDMGTPSGRVQAGASATAPGHSPDVVHNRQWLHALMARHQFDNLPDAWWHFAQRHGEEIPDSVGGPDLAAR